MDAPSTPSEVPAPSRRPVYQVETTGTYSGDVKEAFKRLSFDDFSHVGEIPCARNSLMSGIASGVGIGVIRGFSTNPFVASNWAVGTFLAVSGGMMYICQKRLADERRRVQQVVENLPKRFAKQIEATAPSDSPEPAK